MIDYEPGKEYCVPTIGNVAVILPAHVDQGNGDVTGRHYHVDHRFGPGTFAKEDIDESFAKGQGMTGDITSKIVSDDGRPVVWQTMKAVANWIPSGELFTSTCWLYHNLGTKHAVDGHCVHHRTELQPTGDCMTCPAHGMKFNLDGSPRYQAPFWLCIDNQRVPLSNESHPITGLSGQLRDKVLRLEDDNGEVIATDVASNMSVPDITIRPSDTLHLTLNSWSNNPCLRLK